MPLIREVLMCPPTHFDVRYAINPWMRDAAAEPVLQAHAMQQWSALARRIALHATVRVIEPGADLPDMCFTANAGFVHGKTFVCSRFRHAERRGEETLFWNWFAARGYECERLRDDIIFEGAGDALKDAEGRVWMGHGQRSSLAAARALEDRLCVDVIALHLVDPRFYHLDTCFCPLARGGVLYLPAAFDAPSLAQIEARFSPAQRIIVSESDAMRFACNVVDLGDTVIVNSAGDAMRRALEERGIAVEQLPLSEFLKSGGAAKCLVLALDTATAARDYDPLLADASSVLRATPPLDTAPLAIGSDARNEA